MRAYCLLASNCNCACMSTYKSLNKVTFRAHFTLKVYFIDNLSANPNKKVNISFP
jgi:hypothetical protein